MESKEITASTEVPATEYGLDKSVLGSQKELDQAYVYSLQTEGTELDPEYEKSSHRSQHEFLRIFLGWEFILPGLLGV